MSVEKGNEEELDLITLAEAAKEVGCTPEYLNMLARQEKLQAMKIGRNWMTTKIWADDFFHPELKVARLAKAAAQREVEQKEIAQREAAAKKESRSILDKPKSEEGKLENFYFDELKEAERFNRKRFFKFFSSNRISKRWWESSRVFSLAVVLILIFLGVAQAARVKQAMSENNISNEVAQLPAEEGKIVALDVTEPKGEVLGTETEKGSVLLASENFAIKSIKFGGDVSLLAASYENFPIQLTDVRSQIVTTKKQDEFQLLVYWKTNKLALSNIKYAKMGSDAGKTFTEDDFGFSHSVIIPGLEAATAYTYVITAKDKWGNTITSDRYSAYTGAKNVSVFDLIVKAAEDTFGWAKMK